MDFRAFSEEDIGGGDQYYEDPEDLDLEQLANYLQDQDGLDDSSLDFYDSDSPSAYLNQMPSDPFDLTSNCIHPTLHDALHHFLIPILVANLSARLFIFLIDSLLRKYPQLIPSSGSRISRILAFVLINLRNFVLIVAGAVLLGYHFRMDSSGFKLFISGAVILTSLFIPTLLLLLPSGGGTGNDIKPTQQNSISVWILWVVTMTLISMNEAMIFVFEQEHFVKLRPNVMLIVMKSVSYYYEESANIGSKSESKPFLGQFFRTYLDFLAYLIHPNSLILGVWHPHESQNKNIHPSQSPEHSSPDQNSLWISLPNSLLRSALSFVLCLLFLLVSSCFIDYYLVGHLFDAVFDFMEAFVPDSFGRPVELVLLSYSTAVQFHFSHYFICFAAQSMFDLWDIRMTITRPIPIELPRSLVDVVVAWNIPMHQWLKRYVFQPFKRYCGNNIYATIFFTYFISSYLHGFNFQIWTVLLTLGLLTQAEFKLRHRLASIFSACIESRACSHYTYGEEEEEGDEEISETRRSRTQIRCSKPNHSHTGSGMFSAVRLVNLGFTLLALVNLAFLGSTFDGKPDSSNLSNVWFIWSSLYFYSHIIAIVMFVLYKIV